MFKEFIAQYGMEILQIIITGMIGFIGIAIKSVFKNQSDEKTKEKVVKTVVAAIDQMYSDLTGTEKYEKAVESITEMLNEKGISATELEVQMLIESCVKEMKDKIPDWTRTKTSETEVIDNAEC